MFSALVFDRKRLFRAAAASAALLLFILFLNAYNRVEKPALVNTFGRSFEKAVVTGLVQDNLQEDGSRFGEQIVLLKMRTGPLKGREVQANSSGGYLFGATCSPGMKVVALSSVSGDQHVVSVYSLDREGVIYSFAGIFLLLLCVIGGKNGVKSAAGLLFTMACIFFLYLPMIYKGISPFWAAVLVVVITTIVTMYLIGGLTVKTISAILGTVFGVVVAGLSATLFGHFAGISGYNVPEVESLLFVAQSSEMQIGGLLFSGILIAALGAVMDVAMSISSTLSEIYANSPRLTRRELFKSGINVGRDMMGTMSNTLILAFTGGSLGVLVLNYAYDLPYRQMINSYNIGIELMQGISGSLGIILTVPLVSLAAAVLLTAEKNRLCHPAKIREAGQVIQPDTAQSRS